MKHNGAIASTNTYDSNGNRLSHNGTTGTYDEQDRLPTYGAAAYTYTQNSELLTKTEGGATTHYDYDVLGNLRQAILPGDVVIDYVIDSRNRRVGKKVNGVLVQGLLYQDQLNPVAELDGNGNMVSRFVYGSRSYEDAYFHVMNRSAGKKPAFHYRRYFEAFLECLAVAHTRFGLVIHAYDVRVLFCIRLSKCGWRAEGWIDALR